MKRFNLFRFVFALVFGCHINGVKSQKCDDGYYLDPNGICTACNCSTTGTRNLNCDGTGQCNCYEDSYTGLKCDICVKGQIRTNRKCCWENYWYDWSKRDCTACNCHSVGSKGRQCSVKSGQCPCISKWHSGRQCNRCVHGLNFSNGYCCHSYEYYYDPKKPGSCTPCDCNGRGSPDKVCGSRTGQCTCREGYKGRRCDDVSIQAVSKRIDDIYVISGYKYYVVFEHHCNGNCDVWDLSVITDGYVDVDMYGSTEKFKSDFTSGGDSVCNGISGSKKGDVCQLWHGGLLSVSKFYVVLLSDSNFCSHTTTYYVKIANYKEMKMLYQLNG